MAADYKATGLDGTFLLRITEVSKRYKRLLKAYYYLIKPGIVYSNVMTGAAGYLFASRWAVNFSVFVFLLLGMASLIAAACIVNNYIDRDIDSKMSRTKKRALVTGAISAQSALGLALILGLLGVLFLLRTNIITLVIGVLSVFFYVVLYGYFKRRSVHGTLVGTLPGAASLLAGYTAYTGRLDITALLLFLIMVAWQMAHFYCIALYRLKDYTDAGIPVWPAVRGVDSTKRMIVLYIALFACFNILLSILGDLGYVFAFVMFGVSLYWLVEALKSYSSAGSDIWAKKLFFYSLVVLMSMSLMLPLSTVLI